MPRSKNLAVNAVLFCFVWVLLAGAAEAAFRVTGTDAPGYVTPDVYGNVNLLYRPNSRTRWRGNLGQAREYDTPITTNSLAQFDREHAVEKPDGVYRVIVAGDSFVEALQVPLEQGFARLLEDKLNQDPDVIRSGRRVEVIKFGSSGYGAIRTYEAVKTRGFQYEPDLVLGFFTDSNDFNDDWHYYRRQTGKEVYNHPNLKPSKTLYDKTDFYKKLLVFPGSRLNRWIAFQATQWREKNRSRKQDAGNWKDALGAYALPGSPRFADEAAKWNEALRLTLAGHMKLKMDAAARGALYAVVLNDRPQTYRPDAYKYLFDLMPGLEKEVDLDLPAKALKKYLTGQNIEWLDLNEAFKARAAAGRSGHYVYDGHWNADGHRWTAEALVPFVKERMLGGKKS